jgi:hypothetical protein
VEAEVVLLKAEILQLMMALLVVLVIALLLTGLKINNYPEQDNKLLN